ncbi:MAG: outer membrane beta-barrel protein [Bacteroidota bacterium]|nr:outer membrane beta-barrel protein [Bacteroidota bacterium]
MYHLLRRKIAWLVLPLLFCSTVSRAQLRDNTNLVGHDDKPYHFGINLGYNVSHFSFDHHPVFLQSDSIMKVESSTNAGINLAWLVNLRLGDHFDLRVHPLDLTFSEAGFLYTQKYSPDTLVVKKVQSVRLSFPFLVAFSSDRLGNFKAYTIAGGDFSYDLASNAGAKKADNMVKLKSGDFSLEVGMGCHIYFPYFVLSPEIKVSEGLINLHSRDPNLLYSNVIDRINSRMITFSLTVE